MPVRLCVRMAEDEREGNVSGQSPLPLLIKQQQEEQSSQSGLTSFSCHVYIQVWYRFQENSITEESEDDVFTEEQAAMDTEEDMDEVEIATIKDDNGASHKVLDWTTSDVVSVDNDISGVEPLEVTTETDHKVRYRALFRIFRLLFVFPGC